jgi:5-enolpyruvylshikimate-3-phosphate synthase
MAAAIAATISDGPICILNAEAIQKSYPAFFATILA